MTALGLRRPSARWGLTCRSWLLLVAALLFALPGLAAPAPGKSAIASAHPLATAAGLEAVNPKFNVTVLGMPWGVLLESRRQGKLPVTVAGWVEDYHDPHNWAQPFLHSQGNSGRILNLPPELSARVDDLIMRGAKETDPAKRKPIYEEIQKITQEEVISIWMYQAMDGVHFQKWINGFYYNPAYGNPELAEFYMLSKDQP